MSNQLKGIYVLKEEWNDSYSYLREEMESHGCFFVVLEEIHELEERDSLFVTTCSAVTQVVAREFPEVGVVGCAFSNDELMGFHDVDVVILGVEELEFDFFLKQFQRKRGIPWTIAVTQRLRIREQVMGDLDRLYELYDEKHMTDFIAPLYADRDEEEAYLTNYIERIYPFFGYGIWVAELLETGQVIGRFGVENLDLGERVELEMGYMLDQREQGKGLAFEACEAVLKYAAENIGIDYVNCMIDKENEKSIHLAEKLGFTWYGTFESGGKTRERYRKQLLF